MKLKYGNQMIYLMDSKLHIPSTFPPPMRPSEHSGGTSGAGVEVSSEELLQQYITSGLQISMSNNDLKKMSSL